MKQTILLEIDLEKDVPNLLAHIENRASTISGVRLAEGMLAADALTAEFRRGARAFFDEISGYAANHYHGNPAVQKRFDEDNRLVLNWAEMALQEVDPEDCMEWKKLEEVLRHNSELLAALANLRRPRPWYRRLLRLA